jgi:signal recognition particle receptor subunit beta
MASLNPLTREVVFKIVFYGPGLGGKTTTLQHIHAASKPEHRGKMVSLATPMDRTLYFDFLPLRMPLLRGMHVRLQLFTVPGQVYFGATRKLVLTGADGVVFVADSQTGRQDANEEALEDLVMNLAEHNLSLLSIPHTFHWNKRDLPDIVPLTDLDRTLNRQGAPSLGTVATQGEGVFAGLERITRLVLQAYEADLPRSDQESPSRSAPVERPAIEETTIADALRGLAEAPTRARATPADGVVKSGASSPAAGPPPSSLESIPNPIPRRPTGSFDALGNGVPPSSGSPRGTLSSRGTPSPMPVLESGVPQARPVTPPPPPPTRASGQPGPAAPAAAPGPVPAVEFRDGASLREDWGDLNTGPPPASRSVAPSRPPPQALHAFSFGALWPETDRDAVRQTEGALAAGDSAAALLACDMLVTRLLASAAGMTGNAEAPRDPSLVVLLLGLDGRRYLRFRSAVRAARAHEATSPTDALEAYAFAIEVRTASADLPR